jgi:NO-binding membrane sensor protein with MHYT domain
VSTLIETGTGVSRIPDSYEAGVGAANAALSGIRQFPPSAVLVYASVHYILQQVLAGIQSAVGDVPIVGTTTAGKICEGSHQHSIWAMHFVGMLAFSLPCSSSYDPAITFLSTIPSILTSTYAIKIISHHELSHAKFGLGGVLIGAGVGAMYYLSMAATPCRLNSLMNN